MVDERRYDPQYQRLVETMIEAMDERERRLGLDPGMHAKHHRFIEREIGRREQRYHNWQRIKQTVVGGLIVSAAIGVTSWLAYLGRKTLGE